MENAGAIGDAGPMTAGRAVHRDTWRARLDLRRSLQLILAAAWVIDAALQAQPYMFSKAFASQTLAGTASGNPAWVAHSVTWAAAIVAGHPVLASTAFAAIQLLLGVGIAWRPATRPAPSRQHGDVSAS